MLNQATIIEIQRRSGRRGAMGGPGGPGGVAGGGTGGVTIAVENWNHFELQQSNDNVITLEIVQTGTGNQAASSSAHTGTGSAATSVTKQR